MTDSNRIITFELTPHEAETCKAMLVKHGYLRQGMSESSFTHEGAKLTFSVTQRPNRLFSVKLVADRSTPLRLMSAIEKKLLALIRGR
jgi:hypothetical protein